MSTTAPGTSSQPCSRDSPSDVKALKKRVEQLVEENDELRRDKRSFRDASDESRRTLARMRDDIKELRRKLESERELKENALGEVKELQAEVAKTRSGGADEVHIPPLAMVSVSATPGPTDYPSPVEPDLPAKRGILEDLDGPSAMIFDKRKPVDGNITRTSGREQVHSSTTMDSAEGSSRTYPSPADSNSNGVPLRDGGMKDQPEWSKPPPAKMLGKRSPYEDNDCHPNKKARTESSEPLATSSITPSVPPAVVHVNNEASLSNSSIASSSSDIVVDPRRRSNDVRFATAGTAPSSNRGASSSTAPPKDAPPHLKPSRPPLPASGSVQHRPNFKVESPDKRRGTTSQPYVPQVRFAGHSIGPPLSEVKAAKEAPNPRAPPSSFKGPSNVSTSSSLFSTSALLRLFLDNYSLPKPLPKPDSKDLSLPPKPPRAQNLSPKTEMSRVPVPFRGRQSRSPNAPGRSPPRGSGPPAPPRAVRPETAQAYFAIPNVTLPPSHMGDLGGYEYVPSRSRRGGSYASGGRP